MTSLRLLLLVLVPSVRKKARNGTAPGIVVVQFAAKQDKVAVFKARGKLATTKIGLDYDLTHLQQQQKIAAWPGLTSTTSGPRVSRHSGVHRSYL